MRITGAQAVVRILETEGVKVIFGYPGGTVLPIYDALSESGVEHVLVRNEQAAAHAANGYARVSGRVGVCLATSGPGATNLITGIATAYMDSIPIIAVTGQVPLAMIGRDVFQEADITGATEPFTKHNYLVRDAGDIPRVFREAFHIASTGRPGPVLIDIPKDIQMAELEYSYPERLNLKGYQPVAKGDPEPIKKAAAALLEARQPLLCAGGGVISSHAEPELKMLAQQTHTPVATTLMGIGAFPAGHPLSLGMLGGDYGGYAAKRAAEEADLLLILGARMADRSTGDRKEFAKEARIVHIDIDPAEIGKNVGTHIPIVGDIRHVLADLLAELSGTRPPDHGEWLERTARWKEIRQDVEETPAGLNPMEVIRTLSDRTGPDTILVTDVGQHQMWAGRYYRVEKPGTFLTSGGLGTMGYGLPAAIGAKMAAPDKEVVLLIGDGGFQMCLSEMAVVMQQGLSLKILLMNNHCLGMVRELQQHNYGGRTHQVWMKGSPDFAALAEAYGFRAERITVGADLPAAIKKVLCREGPVFAEFMIDPHANVIPVSGGETNL